MCRFACITAVLLTLAGHARAEDAHAEMAAALETQADLQPGLPSIPSLSPARASTVTAAAESRENAARGPEHRAAAEAGARARAGAATVRAAQAASEAAEHAQAARAKERASHVHPVRVAL